MDQDIIKKYNVPVPRYTSYPPANYFHELSNADYLTAVDASNGAMQNHISFYLHIPFCRHLCHYCGCNSYSMARDGMMERYVEALHREIDLVASHIDKGRRIAQIHYGGGSPTAMPVALIRELNEHLLSVAPTIERPEIAIECHPGYLSHEDWQALTTCGFTRYSLGIQDFKADVLKIVNRRPAQIPVRDILDILRHSGATMNMDFIYGLPLQTAASFAETIREAIRLRPDRLVTFSYAHLPQLFKRQQILEKTGLPALDEKNQMYQVAAELLLAAGYEQVGLDHFVLPTDELAIALREGQLHRNFQGYCTRRTTAQVYAFGVTGISQLDEAYAQNGRDIQEYIETIGRGELYIRKGYRLSQEERVVREVVETLMCNYVLCWDELAERLQLSPENIRQSCFYDHRRLQTLADDGLIILNDDGLKMNAEGRPFVRNVAAALDPLMRHSTKNFSKPI